jgi:hypothetical protein
MAAVSPREGATVVLVAADIPGVSYVVTDLGEVASIECAVPTVVERHGRLDVLGLYPRSATRRRNAAQVAWSLTAYRGFVRLRISVVDY